MITVIQDVLKTSLKIKTPINGSNRRKYYANLRLISLYGAIAEGYLTITKAVAEQDILIFLLNNLIHL